MTLTPEQRDVVAAARQDLGLHDTQEWLGILQRIAGVWDISDLDARSYERLLDLFAYRGFRDPRHVPIVEDDYHRLVWRWAEVAPLTVDEMKAISLAADINDLRAISADGLRRLYQYFSWRGIATLDHLARGVMSAKQHALLRVAKQQLNMTETELLRMCFLLGGVLRIEHLSQRGFDRVLFGLCEDGFQMPRKASEPARPGYGRRAGMATPAQIKLIRELWCEWSGEDSEEAMNAWLERFHGVSSLRFVTAPIAGKALTALKAMKRRGREGSAA